MNVRIESYGISSHLAKITDARTGEPINHVTKAEIILEAGNSEPVKAILTIVSPHVDIIADAEIKQVCPCCGRSVEQSAEPEPDLPFIGRDPA